MTLQQAQATVAQLTDRLVSELGAVWTQITDEQAALLARWPTGTPTARRRWLTALRRQVTDLMRTVRATLTGQVPDLLDAAYRQGRDHTLSEVAALTAATVDPALLVRVAGDEVADLLAATRHVQESTKTLIRALARDHINDALLNGRTAVQAGRALAEDLHDVGITAITYRDGSRHGLAEYTAMVLRTRTAETYAAAGFDVYAAAGVRYVELLDNPACGLNGHNGIPKANNLIVPLTVAQQYPVSHPHCVRSSVARVDITTAAQAAAAHRAGSTSTTAAQNADQALVEATRAQAVARRAQRTALAERTARTASGRLATRTDATTSAAQARHVTAAGGTPAAVARHARIARPRTSTEDDPTS